MKLSRKLSSAAVARETVTMRAKQNSWLSLERVELINDCLPNKNQNNVAFNLSNSRKVRNKLSSDKRKKKKKKSDLEIERTFVVSNKRNRAIHRLQLKLSESSLFPLLFKNTLPRYCGEINMLCHFFLHSQERFMHATCISGNIYRMDMKQNLFIFSMLFIFP